MTDELVAVVFANHGRWVARCPRPQWLGGPCRNAEHYGVHAVTGRPGGLTDDAFLCSRCGVEARAEWPQDRYEIARVLMERPVPETRNWLPGETVLHLQAENIEHGILPWSLEELRSMPGGLLFRSVEPLAIEAR